MIAWRFGNTYFECPSSSQNKVCFRMASVVQLVLLWQTQKRKRKNNCHFRLVSVRPNDTLYIFFSVKRSHGSAHILACLTNGSVKTGVLFEWMCGSGTLQKNCCARMLCQKNKNELTKPQTPARYSHIHLSSVVTLILLSVLHLVTGKDV